MFFLETVNYVLFSFFLSFCFVSQTLYKKHYGSTCIHIHTVKNNCCDTFYLRTSFSFVAFLSRTKWKIYTKHWHVSQNFWLLFCKTVDFRALTRRRQKRSGPALSALTSPYLEFRGWRRGRFLTFSSAKIALSNLASLFSPKPLQTFFHFLRLTKSPVSTTSI